LVEHPREPVPVFKGPCKLGKGVQPFIGTEHGRKYGRKRDGGIKEVFEIGRVWKIHVMPILHVLIEIFKCPPKSGTEEK